jgi:hypothetical protein
METKEPTLIERIAESIAEWQKVRSIKESYTVEQVAMFKNVNKLIDTYNSTVEESAKLELIRLSYSSGQLSEIVNKLSDNYCRNTEVEK